jgi:hypothetical protein
MAQEAIAQASFGIFPRNCQSVGTQVVKVFEPCDRARESLGRKSLDKRTDQSVFWDHKAYYPGAQEIGFSNLWR